jgi:hypothetical protein
MPTVFCWIGAHNFLDYFEASAIISKMKPSVIYPVIFRRDICFLLLYLLFADLVFSDDFSTAQDSDFVIVG